MNIRYQTGIIIEKDGEYLVGNVIGINVLRWSASPWDAWRTRRRESADLVARAVGGRQMLFNPVAGQLKTLHPIAPQGVI
jgi:hypothetical protein